DYSFPLNNAFEESASISWVACANELNAGYAADGYARVHGSALLCTTYGVGELSALNAMMGSKAERLPVFHLVGAPGKRTQRSRKPMHHSLGDGEFGQFFSLSAAAACVSTTLTPENTIREMERVIHETFLQRRPAYIMVPSDYALMEVVGESKDGIVSTQPSLLSSEPGELAAALEMILKRLTQVQSSVILPAFTVARYGLQKELEEFLSLSGIPYATTLMDKGVISESNPNYLGMYMGYSSPSHVREAVECADLIINFGGVLFTDLSTMFFSQQLYHSHMITIWPDYVEVGENLSMMTSQSKTYGPVFMGDLLSGLIKEGSRLKKQVSVFHRPSYKACPSQDAGLPDDPISTNSLYPRLQRFLKPEDQLVIETGLCMLPMASMILPQGATYFNQTLWGSIGWATPATLGIALAHPKRRTILVTGDGAHQFTINELGTLGRYGVKPIIIILNDGVYAIEEFLEQNKGHGYNVLTPWAYSQFPKTMGCRDWLTIQIRTNAEFDAALALAEQADTACYFEVLLGPTLRSPASVAMVEALNQIAPPPY
ncbi:MAG TPA: thiamine pyrophosphate-dependent enzyme, partial [Chthoniobacterales bacterium]|nr:thiamine pyrophosphate-dependent enzyme [Chthoniobacterales bacterium]